MSLFLVSLFLLLALPSHSWTIPAYMDLIYPPRLLTAPGDVYIVKSGEIQPGYTNHLSSCLNKPVPPNVTRSLFPITGGELLLGFVNQTLDAPPVEYFSIDMYFSGDGVDYSSNGFFRWGGLKRMGPWAGFKSGWKCAVPMDLTRRLRQPENETALAMLEGLNITFALLIQNKRNYRVFEEVDQCAYVTLTSKALTPRDENAEMCAGVNLDYFASTTSSKFPTATNTGGPTKTNAAAKLHAKLPLMTLLLPFVL